jgi:hypothetical protein
LTKPDPNTGFPEVPEGYFWQIKHAYTAGAFRLELRKKLFWIFSQSVQWTVVFPPLSNDKLFEDALYVLGEWQESKDRIATEEASSVYIGKYPPKNLKDAPK